MINNDLENQFKGKIINQQRIFQIAIILLQQYESGQGTIINQQRIFKTAIILSKQYEPGNFNHIKISITLLIFNTNFHAKTNLLSNCPSLLDILP